MVMNTYTRRYLKPTKEGNSRNDKALVVWVDGADKGVYAVMQYTLRKRRDTTMILHMMRR